MAIGRYCLRRTARAGRHIETSAFRATSARMRVSFGTRTRERKKRLLLRFRDLLDRSGLEVPFQPPDLYEQGEYSRLGGDPDQKSFPQQALAQHLGLPTPLLDWTSRGLVAGYFAAPKKPATEPMIVVWALRRDFLRSGYGHDENYEAVSDHFRVGDSWIKIETAPRSSNPNLHAQASLFTLVRGVRRLAADGRIKAHQEFGSGVWFDFIRIVRIRDGLTHGAVSRPNSTGVPEDEKPSPLPADFLSLQSGQAFKAAQRLLLAMHKAAELGAPGWLEKPEMLVTHLSLQR